MKKFWLGIGCALSLVASTATAFACGPPMDTLCGIVHSVEEVELGEDMVGLILRGPFAFGTISCTCDGTMEDVAVTDMVEVHLYCDAEDAACLGEMDEAISGSFDGMFALFSTLFPWNKMKGGNGFPSFVNAESSTLESVEIWDYQLIQALPPDFAVENRICKAASEIEVPEPPVPFISDSLIPNHAFDTDLPTPEPGDLRSAERRVPPREEPEEETVDPEVNDKLPETDPRIPADEPPSSPEEEIISPIDGELPPAGCNAARGNVPASGWLGLVSLWGMWAMLRRREVLSR